MLETLAAALAARAEDPSHPQADRPALVRFIDRRERATELDWGTLSQRAMAVAGRLVALGIAPGERVMLVYATGPAFFDAFFGCIAAGAVPCPIYPPVRLGRMDEYHGRTARMIQLAGARLVLTDSRIKRVLGEVIRRANPQFGARTLDQLPAGEPTLRPVSPDDLAMVQFSSGTTVDPKPVALTHRAVVAQTRTLIDALQEHTEGLDNGVSWLPLYHDMGLIGCVFPSLLFPGDLTLLAPQDFIAKPALWLRAISQHGGTISPAPNFAYALCVDRIKDAQMEGVDLSSWRVALNGAEPVAPEVLRAFVRRFAQWGLRPEALSPVYGLSEASLAVTFSHLDRPFASLRFERDALADGRAQVDPKGLEIVSLGPPLPGFGVEIRHDGQVLPDGQIGTVWLRGPSLMREYLGRPDDTARALVDGWLDSGDAGFVHAGELYLTGRKKDLLILRGRNHPPHPVEQSVDGLDAARTGCAAAVSYRPEGADSEHLLLFVEHTATATLDQRAELPAQAAQAVLTATGLRCGEVVVLPPGTLPRTSSGKIRRAKALALHLAGELAPPDQVNVLTVAGILARSALGYLRSRDDT
jgi:acyl-CoA synthetase (AMP-forming)/AMP-acid ligase II